MTKVSIKVDGNDIALSNESNDLLTVSNFDPSDLLAGALAKCTSYEVRKFASNKGYNLDSLVVNVDLDRDRETKTANFKVHLNVAGDLEENQLKQLHKVAKKSYINRLLSNNIALDGDVHYNGDKFDFKE